MRADLGFGAKKGVSSFEVIYFRTGGSRTLVASDIALGCRLGEGGARAARASRKRQMAFSTSLPSIDQFKVSMSPAHWFFLVLERSANIMR